MDDPIRALWQGEPDDNMPPGEFAVAQQPDAEGPRAFIDAIKDAALAADASYGVPAGFTVAQAALESGWGKYVPVDIRTGRYSYNLFGVKALPGQDAVTAWTWEHQNGQWVRVQARFRAYVSFQESLDDHTHLLTSVRYSGCLAAIDASAYARCIHRSGYATDPQYADKIIRIMQTWGLTGMRYVPSPPACRVVVHVAGRATLLHGEVRDGAAWCPVRPVAEALGTFVIWDGATRTVRVRA
jgi:flagellum-specific peptidoglycan hydrolase FlgJ